MKKTLLIIVILMIPAMILAENPDSRPSISFGINSRAVSDGTETLDLGRFFDPDMIDYWTRLSLPSHENVTLHLSFAVENIYYDRTVQDYKAINFSFGVKFYIGQSINK